MVSCQTDWLSGQNSREGLFWGNKYLFEKCTAILKELAGWSTIGKMANFKTIWDKVKLLENPSYPLIKAFNRCACRFDD